MSDKPNQLLDKVTRAICAEDCAFRGEPPCWEICPDEWPNPNCDEPGCRWHAIAALAVMMEEMERGRSPR